MSSKKQRVSRSASNRQPKQPQKQRGFGRPQDDELQTFFMKKLRNCKLQVINAQSQAEIQFYKFKDANPQAITNRKLQNDDDNYTKQKLLMIKNWFKEIDSERYELLWNSFKYGVEKWEFKQIKSIQDFPEYLFCDECDLSYILYTVLNSPEQGLKNNTEFNQTELLFLQLLCFAARDQISFRIIYSFKEVTEQIIKNMSGLKEKVVLHYQKSIQAERNKLSTFKTQENSTQKMDQIMQNDAFPIELIKGAAVKIPDQEYERNFKKMKTKKINKQEKSGKGCPRNKVEACQQSIKIEDLEILLHKLITHIAWAYRYIYSEQKKKKELIISE